MFHLVRGGREEGGWKRGGWRLVYGNKIGKDRNIYLSIRWMDKLGFDILERIVRRNERT